MSGVDKVLNQIKAGRKLPYRQIDEWIQNGQFEALEAIVQAVFQIRDDGFVVYQHHNYKSCFDRIVQGLSLTKGQSNVEALLKILVQRPQDDELIRCMAAQLAATQDPQVLDDLINSLKHSDLWGYVIHELVIEGIDLSLYANLTEFAHSMKENHHPLSRLPLELLPVEQGIGYHRWHYKIGGGASKSIPFGPLRENDNKPVLPEKPSNIVFVDTTPSDLEAKLDAISESWIKFEARQFTTQSTFNSDLITDSCLLLELNLECLQGTTRHQIAVWKVAAERIMNMLFSSAANGAAYSNGIGNAYGRLLAWESVAGLVNEPEQIPIALLNEKMKEYLWFELDANSDWFHRDLWDMGIIALDHDRRVITVLAATDTD